MSVMPTRPKTQSEANFSHLQQMRQSVLQPTDGIILAAQRVGWQAGCGTWGRPGDGSEAGVGHPLGPGQIQRSQRTAAGPPAVLATETTARATRKSAGAESGVRKCLHGRARHSPTTAGYDCRHTLSAQSSASNGRHSRQLQHALQASEGAKGEGQRAAPCTDLIGYFLGSAEVKQPEVGQAAANCRACRIAERLSSCVEVQTPQAFVGADDRRDGLVRQPGAASQVEKLELPATGRCQCHQPGIANVLAARQVEVSQGRARAAEAADSGRGDPSVPVQLHPTRCVIAYGCSRDYP